VYRLLKIIGEDVIDIKEIGKVILDAVNLTDIDPESLTPETTLMDGGLELDSVDLLEAVVAIESFYNVKISDAEEGREYFLSLGKIKELIEKKRG